MRSHGMDLSPNTRYEGKNSAASTMSTDSDGDVPPLLKEYFDKAGDLMLLHGRLEDLDLEEAEKLTLRELLRDQDAALAKTDEEFAREYFDLRSQLQERVKTLQLQMEDLRLKCEISGFDIDQAKWSMSSPRLSDVLSAHTSVPISTPITIFPSVQDFGQARDHPSTGTGSKRPVKKAEDLISRFQRLRSSSTTSPVLSSIPNQNGETTCADQRSQQAALVSAPGEPIPLGAHSRAQSIRDVGSVSPVVMTDISNASQSTSSLLPSSNPRKDPWTSESSRPVSPLPMSMKRGSSLPENKSSLVQSATGAEYNVKNGDDLREVEGIDRSGVHFKLKYGPPECITDPELRKIYGVSARKIVAGTPGEVEANDSSFHIPLRPSKFFRQGRVFAILWAEEPNAESDAPITEITYNATMSTGDYAKVRRFVIIRAMQDYCSSIPITTNNAKGVSIEGVKKSDFAVIHTSKVSPAILPGEYPVRGEPGMRSMSIRVDADDISFRLDPLSRLNFGKVYTIYYSVKVKSIGMVNRSSMRDLLYQFRDVWKSAFTPPNFEELPISATDTTNSPGTSMYRASLDIREREDVRASPTASRMRGELRTSTDKKRVVKHSLNDNASSVVDQLLSRGHSVDQILSAFEPKGFGQEQMFGAIFSEDVD